MNEMTPKCLMCLKHEVNIWLTKQTSKECIVVFLDIRSDNIADHIIDADIYDKAFAYFVDEVEIMMEMLDNKTAPTEEVHVESEV